jgi:hypothetical protein
MPFEVIPANLYQVRNIPRAQDGCTRQSRLAELLAQGLIRPSFVPPRDAGELRDLTRSGEAGRGTQPRAHNRIHKVLEDACIKLDTIASDIPGKTGRAIIHAIIGGQEHPDWLADQGERKAARQTAGTSAAISGKDYRTSPPDAPRNLWKTLSLWNGRSNGWSKPSLLVRSWIRWRVCAPFPAWIS